jgi:hypothetical protein
MNICSPPHETPLREQDLDADVIIALMNVRFQGDCVAKLENRFSKILAKASRLTVFIRDTLLKRMGGPRSESV